MKARKRQASGTYTVDDEVLTWSLIREAHYSTDGYRGMTFSVRADGGHRTLRELVIAFPYPKHKPGFHQEKERVLPPLVEKAIRIAMDMGWNPTSRGRTFILELDHDDLA